MSNDKEFEDWKLRKEFDALKKQELKNEPFIPVPIPNSPSVPAVVPPMESKPNIPTDMQKKIENLEKAGYIPRYSNRPIHVGLMRKIGPGGFPVVLDWIDLPLRAERAQYRHEKEYVIDGRNALYHDHKSGKSVLLYDMDKNLPLVGSFQDQPNSKSADLQAIYGVKESFRQFIAGIRQELNRNIRQTVVMAIIFMVSGIVIGHFI